jgi:tRNA threonylcarbamoyl adenosine modification protein YeaZ
MTDAPLILAFDTSGPYCAAAVLRGTQVLAVQAEDMTRGQAERLMPMLEEVLAGAKADWQDLQAIAVGVGPGNFTGIRIAVSAARGLALGLSIPAYGIDGFDAGAQAADTSGLPTVPAPREQVYLRNLDGDAQLLPETEAAEHAAQAGLPLLPRPTPKDIAVAIAQVALHRWPDATLAPAPLYLREADAAPARDLPPALLDG